MKNYLYNIRISWICITKSKLGRGGRPTVKERIPPPNTTILKEKNMNTQSKNKKNIITIRLSDSERQRLNEYAEANYLTVSAGIRQIISAQCNEAIKSQEQKCKPKKQIASALKEMLIIKDIIKKPNGMKKEDKMEIERRLENLWDELR